MANDWNDWNRNENRFDNRGDNRMGNDRWNRNDRDNNQMDRGQDRFRNNDRDDRDENRWGRDQHMHSTNSFPNMNASRDNQSWRDRDMSDNRERDFGGSFGSGRGREFNRGTGMDRDASYGQQYRQNYLDAGRSQGRDYGYGADYGSFGRDSGRGSSYDFARSHFNESTSPTYSQGYGSTFSGSGGTGYGSGFGGGLNMNQSPNQNWGSQGWNSSNRDTGRDFGRDTGMNRDNFGSGYGDTTNRSWGDANNYTNPSGSGDFARYAGLASGTTSGMGTNRQSYAGRGPKGWKRSDDRVREDVSEALERHPDIDASEIEIDVKDGIVTLRGHVDERRTKRMAEDVIEHMAGVRDVRNELSVNQSLFDRAKEFLTGESSGSTTKTTTKTSTTNPRH